jgi:hypothetical protein
MSHLHDNVARAIAITRFPFKDQKDWPADNVTIVNAGQPTRSIPTTYGEHFPDILIVAGTGEIKEVAEVEGEWDEARIPLWRAGSLIADNRTTSGAQHFFLYVPMGDEERAIDMLESNGISYAGVRGWRLHEDGTVEVVPFGATVDAKDARITRGA